MKDLYKPLNEDIACIDSEKFLACCLRTRGNYYYRGQGDSSWDLIPSVFRDEQNKLIETGSRRKRLLYFDSEEFDQAFERLQHASNEAAALDLADSGFAKLQKMVFFQHFGISTPLLDWSQGPLIALFMAYAFRPSSSSKIRIYRLDLATKPFDLQFQRYDRFNFERIRKQVGGVSFVGTINPACTDVSFYPHTILDLLEDLDSTEFIKALDVSIDADGEHMIREALDSNGFTFDSMFPNSPYWLGMSIKATLPWANGN